MHNVVIDYNPSHTDNDAVREGLISMYEKTFGERDKPFSIFLKDNFGKVLGGLQAFIDSESIYIDIMWIQEDLRNQGYGKNLLDAAEQEATQKGCKFLLVDTWDFQSEDFYLKNGYERIGELKNYWFNHSKFFLRKSLKSEVDR